MFLQSGQYCLLHCLQDVFSNLAFLHGVSKTLFMDVSWTVKGEEKLGKIQYVLDNLPPVPTQNILIFMIYLYNLWKLYAFSNIQCFFPKSLSKLDVLKSYFTITLIPGWQYLPSATLTSGFINKSNKKHFNENWKDMYIL